MRVKTSQSGARRNEFASSGKYFRPGAFTASPSPLASPAFRPESGGGRKSQQSERSCVSLLRLRSFSSASLVALPRPMPGIPAAPENRRPSPSAPACPPSRSRPGEERSWQTLPLSSPPPPCPPLAGPPSVADPPRLNVRAAPFVSVTGRACAQASGYRDFAHGRRRWQPRWGPLIERGRRRPFAWSRAPR